MATTMSEASTAQQTQSVPTEIMPSESQTASSDAERNPSMTDRYTNAEWAAQITETQREVLGNDGSVRKEWKIEGMKDGNVRTTKLAQMIDHTLLKLDATASQIDTLCAEARTEGFKSVCVRLPYVARCVSNLKGSPVIVACVVGFHEGTQDTYAKLQEAQAAVAAGASELDIVLNHPILNSVPSPSSTVSSPTTPTVQNGSNGSKSHRTNPSDSTQRSRESITASNTAANAKPRSSTSSPPSVGPYSVPGTSTKGHHSRSGSNSNSRSSSPATPPLPNYQAIYTELASLRSLCPAPTVLKLIFETSQLTPAQILAASTLAAAANFDFIKTSTGFSGRGASVQDVELMVAASRYLATQQPSGGGSPVRRLTMQVKASGGIRSLEGAVKMMGLGATRLGTSSGLWIMQEARREHGKGEKAKTERPGGGVTRLYTDNSIDGY